MNRFKQPEKFVKCSTCKNEGEGERETVKNKHDDSIVLSYFHSTSVMH